MAQRTDTELKVFLNGDYEEQYSKLADKTGTVFFDKTRRAVYAEGVLITSDVVDVKVEGSVLKVKKVGEPTYTEIADLAIPDTFLQKTDVVNTLDSSSTDLPLSAAQGKELKRQIDEKVTAENDKGLSTNDYTDADKTKLAGIEKGAQKNRVITVNGNPLGNDNQETNITITGNLLRTITDQNFEDGALDISLGVVYSKADKTIYFKNGDTDDATNIATIDVSDFIKDSFVKSGSYNSSKKALILTLVTGKNDDGSDKTEEITIPVGDLIDEYTAGNGLTVNNNQFSAKLGYGLEFDAQNKIKLYPNPNGGIKVDAGGVALKAATNGGIIFGDGGGIAVDFTKAPVQSVNGQTGAVTIDVTPKVWSF